MGARMAAEFARSGAMLLPGFLDPDFCRMIEPIWRNAEFVRTPAPRVGERLLESPGRAGDGLTLALQRPELHRWLETVTGCGPLDDAQGHIARHDGSCEQALEWHDDRSDQRRRLAITINLDDRPYDGGIFELRARDGGRPMFRHVHAMVGEALVFEVSRRMEHRLTPVTSGGPRTVFAGWFLETNR